MSKICLMLCCLMGTGLFAQQSTNPGDTTFYTILGPEKPIGVSKMWYSDATTLHTFFEYNDRGRGPKISTTVRLGADGMPISLQATGNDYLKSPVNETFSFDGRVARWKNSAESGEKTPTEKAYYVSLNGDDGSLFVKALLASPSRKIALLPAGAATLEKVMELTVRANNQSCRVIQYAISGMGFTPYSTWYDSDGSFFFSGSTWSATVRKGWESVRERLVAAQDSTKAIQSARRDQGLARTPAKPLVFRNVRLFDAPTATVLTNQTVLVEGNRIRAVGDEGKVKIPANAEVVDGRNKTLLPGLWDMHVHIFDTDGLLHLAAGVTSVRDMANDTEATLKLRDDFATGRKVGPRLLMAGFMDGRGPFQGPTKVFADNQEEAKTAIDNYARLGYPQIKIYSSIKPELVPFIIRYAHQKGMRVSGHIPSFMTAEQAIRHGLDEMQHINFVFLNFLPDTLDTRSTKRFSEPARHAADLDLRSEKVKSFVQLLKEKNVVLDLTLNVFEEMFTDRPGEVSHLYATVADRMPPQVRRGFLTGGLPVPDGMDEQYRKSFQATLKMTKMLYDAGITLVAGTDALAGFALHRELELYAQAGIPAPKVLQIATYNAAKVMKKTDELGSVTVGKLADLVLVEGDPTTHISDIRRTVMVVKDGRVYLPDQLHQAVGIQPR